MERKKIEIERKFLMKSLPKVQWNDIIVITQYYIEGDDRLRYSTHLDGSKTVEYIKKKKIGMGESIEIEKDYDPNKAIDLISKSKSSLFKTRYVYIENDFKFEIDLIFDNLIIMEVELDSLDTKIVFPHEIEKCIIKEVTGDQRYSSRYISKNY